MADFIKAAYAERYRYYDISREDGMDGLADGETIADYEVICVEKDTGTDCTSTMISNTSIVDDTKVAYLLAAGEAGKSYIIYVYYTTSNGQKDVGIVEIMVI